VSTRSVGPAHSWPQARCLRDLGACLSCPLDRSPGPEVTVLVLRARSGDKAAFAVLVERHRPTAVALVSRVLDRREDLDDVLQEAAVQALVCLDRLRDASRFGPWLYRVALNLARRQLRDRVRQR
jgi:DNA-directed RNA polymerase specialized sigma24 family protein